MFFERKNFLEVNIEAEIDLLITCVYNSENVARHRTIAQMVHKQSGVRKQGGGKYGQNSSKTEGRRKYPTAIIHQK